MTIKQWIRICISLTLLILCHEIQAQIKPLVIPKQASDGSKTVLGWQQITWNKNLPKFTVIGSSVLNKQWAGNTVILFEPVKQVVFPFNPGAVGPYLLQIGTVSGNGLEDFDVLLNGQKIGHCQAGGTEAKPVVLQIKTPTAWAHGNVLALARDVPGEFGVLYISYEPAVFEKIPNTIWKRIPSSNSSSTKRWRTAFHNPVPFSRPVWKLSSQHPCSLYLNGKLFLQTKGKMVMGKLPYGLNDRVNELVLQGDDEVEDLVLELHSTPLEGARFLRELPNFLDGRKHVNDWPRVTLQNKWITAVVAMPDTQKGFYRGPRFEQAGMVTSLRYAGHEWMSCNHKVGRNPTANDHVAGPAGEFAEPLGYDIAAVGESFVKVGVGLLEKPNADEYFFGSQYFQVKIFPWQSTVTRNKIIFRQKVQTESGYGYEYTKTVLLPMGKSQMVINHTLLNNGEKRIDTSHYAHNFFLLDYQPPSSDYQLTYGFTPSRKSQNALSMLKKVADRSYIFQSEKTWYTAITGCLNTSENWSQLDHLPTGLSLRITESQPPVHQALYLCREGICPESFTRISLAPGSQMSWERIYEMGQKK